jgi:hypothetical protein
MRGRASRALAFVEKLPAVVPSRDGGGQLGDDKRRTADKRERDNRYISFLFSRMRESDRKSQGAGVGAAKSDHSTAAWHAQKKSLSKKLFGS